MIISIFKNEHDNLINLFKYTITIIFSYVIGLNIGQKLIALINFKIFSIIIIYFLLFEFSYIYYLLL